MKIKISLLDLANMESSLNVLMQTKLPAGISFRIARLVATLGPDLEAYHKKHTELLSQYAEASTDNPQLFHPKKGNEEILNKEMNNLFEETVKFEWNPIEVDKLGDNIGELLPIHFLRLSKLFTE